MLTKNIIVPLLNNKNISIKELYLLQENFPKNFYAYCCDKDSNITYSQIIDIFKLNTAEEILKITLDNKESFEISENGNFLMRDGTIKKAKDLKENDSLMPLYRKRSKKKNIYDYELTFVPSKNKYSYTHSLMANYNDYKKENKEKSVVHHIDFNKFNNNPDNLRIMSWEDHTNLHASEMIKLNEYAKSEKGRAKSRELMKKNWENPEFREKMTQRMREKGKELSEITKKNNGGKTGFQLMDKEKLRKITGENGKKQKGKKKSEESISKQKETFQKRLENDPIFKEELRLRALNASLAAAQIPANENQKKARSENAKATNAKRWSKKDIINHKIIKIEKLQPQETYVLKVSNYSFALNVGIFVIND